MRQHSNLAKDPAEKVVKDIRRATRKQYSAEEKIRIVLDVLDTDILVSAVAQAAKGLHLHRIGPQQSSRGRCKRRHPLL